MYCYSSQLGELRQCPSSIDADSPAEAAAMRVFV